MDDRSRPADCESCSDAVASPFITAVCSSAALVRGDRGATPFPASDWMLSIFSESSASPLACSRETAADSVITSATRSIPATELQELT